MQVQGRQAQSSAAHQCMAHDWLDAFGFDQCCSNTKDATEKANASARAAGTELSNILMLVLHWLYNLAALTTRLLLMLLLQQECNL
jgi:hypothetical protein